MALLGSVMDTTEPSPPPKETLFATERNPRLRFLIPIVVACAFFMEHVDSTVIATALPQMAKDLDATVLHLSVAVTAYVLTLAVFIPVSGWFADRYGNRRIFMLALCIFTVSSVLCGMAESVNELIATRCIQGFGGALMTPVGRLILLRSFPRTQLVTAMLYMSLPALIGPVIGPLLGGLLTSYVSWRWIFYINVPFGILGIVLALAFIEEVRGDTKTKFDFLGFSLAGAGLALLLFGIENLSRPVLTQAASAFTVAAAVLLLLAFARHARNHSSPAIDLSLFHSRTFRIGTLAGGICRIGMNGVPFLLPLMLQIGMGLSPVQSGTLTFFTSLGAIIVRSISAQALRVLGFDRVLLWNALLSSILTAGFGLVTPGLPYWVVAIYISAFGLARSTQFMTSNMLTYSDVPSEKLSRATSLASVLQQLSVSFGVSLSALLLGLVSQHNDALRLSDFHEVFLLVALLPLIAIPGLLYLRPEDGTHVSGHQRRRRGGRGNGGK